MKLFEGWHKPEISFEPNWVHIIIGVAGLIACLSVFGWRGAICYLAGSLIGSLEIKLTRFDGKLRVIK